MANMNAAVTCIECGTHLGGDTPKDPYSHLLVCLHAAPDSLERMKETAERARSENGRRIVHIVDAMLATPAETNLGGGE